MPRVVKTAQLFGLDAEKTSPLKTLKEPKRERGASEKTLIIYDTFLFKKMPIFNLESLPLIANFASYAVSERWKTKKEEEEEELKTIA